MSKVMFHGLAAWVGAIRGSTACDWWASDPAQINFDRSLLYTIDLANTPSAALAGRISVSQIDVDDHTTQGGRTTIGPVWPSGAQIGGCWVSDAWLARQRVKPKPGPPAGATSANYEHMIIQYFDGEQNNRRFFGFHAVLVQTQAKLSLVEIWNPGKSGQGIRSAGRWWLDLAADADPNTPPLQPNKPGALFLERAAAGQLTTFQPKLPPYQGGFALAG